MEQDILKKIIRVIYKTLKSIYKEFLGKEKSDDVRYKGDP